MDSVAWDDMTLRERDALVAEHVMKWKYDGKRGVWILPDGRIGRNAPYFTTNRDVCAEAEAALIARGLGEKYAAALQDLMPDTPVKNRAVWWMTAHPDYRCRAMLCAVGVEV